jgi:hypothetical protein
MSTQLLILWRVKLLQIKRLSITDMSIAIKKLQSEMTTEMAAGDVLNVRFPLIADIISLNEQVRANR